MHHKISYRVERHFSTGTVISEDAKFYIQATDKARAHLSGKSRKLQGVMIIRIEETVVSYDHVDYVHPDLLEANQL